MASWSLSGSGTGRAGGGVMPRYLVAAIMHMTRPLLVEIWPMISGTARLLGPSTCYMHTRPPVLSSLGDYCFCHVAGRF